MANIYKNIFGDRSGYCKTSTGKMILTGSPRFDDNWNYMEITKNHPAAIRTAIIYADFAKTQELYLDRELVTGVSAYTLAIADWFSMPKVLEINVDAWTGKPDQIIRIKARENIGVAGVSVVIRDAEGRLVERGEAVPSKSGNAWWRYTTKACTLMNPFPNVEAIARDLAGNQDIFRVS